MVRAAAPATNLLRLRVVTAAAVARKGREVVSSLQVSLQID
jgi:hypothetical protein